VGTSRSLVVVGTKDLSSPHFIGGGDVSMMLVHTALVECVDKSFLMTSILFSKKSAKLFASC
jgi:hypothetical protein